MAIDTEAVRRQHPLADIVAGYGIELRRSGCALVGRCPFHADGGRPNLTVYGRSGRWVCYRCGEGGEVIGFVGTTGNAPKNTPHLHFAISILPSSKEWWKGTPIDPYPLLVQPK